MWPPYWHNFCAKFQLDFENKIHDENTDEEMLKCKSFYELNKVQ